jgi:aldehyde:ferredoxin oxidoreductase
VDDLESVAYMNYLCYELGIDPIETGNILAIYADATEKKALKGNQQVAGLKWNDVPRMIELISLIVERRAEGALLSKGVEPLVAELGDGSLSTASKGITIQNADPRIEPAWGLLNATENSGSSIHIWVYPDLIYSFAMINGIKSLLPPDKENYGEIVKIVKRKQDLVSALDSLQVCAFSNMAFNDSDYVDALEAVVGWKWTVGELYKAGERIFNLERAINNRFGLSEDKLAPKFLYEKIENGVDMEMVWDFHSALSQYYDIRGWNDGVVNVGAIFKK